MPGPDDNGRDGFEAAYRPRNAANLAELTDAFEQAELGNVVRVATFGTPFVHWIQEPHQLTVCVTLLAPGCS